MSEFENIINFKDICKENEIITADWNGSEIKIKPILSLREMAYMVDRVVDVCFDKESGAYIPEIKEYAIRVLAIELYSNVALPDDKEEKYEAVYNEGLFEEVEEHINTAQYLDILNAIDKKIDLLVETNINTLTIQINELISKFTEIEKGLGIMYENITPEEISGFVKSLSGVKVDEDKIIKAVLNQKGTTINGKRKKTPVK